MSFYLFFLFVIFAILVAFMSAVVSGLSQDDLNIITEKDEKKANLLQGLKTEHESRSNPFLIIEVFFYTFAGLLLGALVLDIYKDWTVLIYAGAILFVSTLAIRTTFYFIGHYFALFLSLRFFPVISFLSFLSKPFRSLFGYLHNRIYGQESNEAKREEINALLESSHVEGSIDSGEYRILKNMMRFGDVLVSDVMTPRTVMFTSEADMTVGEVVNLPELQMYSRFPIWEGDSLDNGVIGYVLSKDILQMALVCEFEDETPTRAYDAGNVL